MHCRTSYVFHTPFLDLVPREAVIGWLKHLRLIHPTFAFRSASAFLPKNPGNSKTNLKGKAKESVDDALGCKQLLEYLNQCEVDLGTDSLRVAVIGITNVRVPLYICVF